MTFSIAARCARTGMVGVAVSSSSPAVAARCAHVRAGVGAVASQNLTDPRLAFRVLDLMGQGRAAPDAVGSVVDDERERSSAIDYRQLLAVDRAGTTGSWSGARTLEVHAEATGPDVVAAGNLLASAAVPEAMVDAFASGPDDHLGSRLVRALLAGFEAGGETLPVRSAGLVVADAVPWPIVDLRVDWEDDPIDRLSRLWELWGPQIDDYVTRALDPEQAPAFRRGADT